MPWYTYVCEKCGELEVRKASLAYRDVMPLHRADGCGDGRLKRLRSAAGPGDVPRPPVRRGPALVADGPARAASRAAEARPPEAGAAEREVRSLPTAPPPDLERAWDDCVLDALSSTMAEVISAPRRVELIPRLLAMLPTLSLKLRLVEIVARRGGADAEAAALGEALAAEIASSPVEALARERRLLELLLLATRHAKLGTADVERRLADDRVMIRLLRSAVRWTAPEGPGNEEVDPPFLAWAELRRIARGPLLRARILELAALPSAGDAWDRLVIEAAARPDTELRSVG